MPTSILHSTFVTGLGASSAYFLSKLIVSTDYNMFNIGVSSALAGIGGYLAAAYADTH